MNTTITETLPYDFKNGLSQLKIILTVYEEETDFLSQDLKKWGERVVDTAKHSRFLKRKELNKIVNDYMSEFFDLVMDSLSNNQMEHPVKERSWWFDKNTHTQCKKLFNNISPLDDETMLENPLPHYFAEAMIAWSKDVPVKRPLSNQQMTLVSEPSQITEVFQRISYQNLANSQRRERRTREAIDSALERVNRAISDIVLSNQQLVREAEMKEARREEELKSQIALLKSTQENRLIRLEGQMNVMKEFHLKNVQALEQEIALKEQASQKTATTLREQLTQMKRAQVAECSALGQQINSLKTTHQIVQEEQKQKILDADAAASKLREEVVATQNKTAQAQAQYHEAYVQNAHNAQKAHQLEVRLQRALQENQSLRDEIDGYCITM